MITTDSQPGNLQLIFEMSDAAQPSKHPTQHLIFVSCLSPHLVTLSLLVFFQATGKCLSPYPSRRKKPSSTKDRRKVSGQSSYDLAASLSRLSYSLPLSLVQSRWIRSLTRLVHLGYLTPSVLRHSQEVIPILSKYGDLSLTCSRFTLVVTVARGVPAVVF